MREFRELGERDLLAMVHETCHRRLEGGDGVFLRKLGKALRTDADGGDGGPEVAFEEVRHARIDGNDVEDAGNRLALRYHLDGRKAKTFPKISVASAESEPGDLPPTSELWAILAVRAISRSPEKTGMQTTRSLRCVTPP